MDGRMMYNRGMASSLPDSGQAGEPQDTENETPDEQREEVLDEFNSRFKHAKSHWSEWRTEARMMYDLVAGRQWEAEDESRMKEELRPMVTFNVSGKYLDAVQGLQINNRQEIRFYPREQGDAQANELLTGSVAWGRDLCDQADEETDAFYDCILTGLGWMEGYLDKDLEPSGVPAGQRVDNMEMYPDPSARKRNLEDARYCIRIKNMDHDEYEAMFGEDTGYAPDREMVSLDDDDGEIEVIESPQDYDKGPGSSSAYPKKGKCPVADYQFWKRETRYLLNHPALGEKELTEEEYKAYQPFFQLAVQNGQRFQLQQIKKKVYYRAFIANGRVGEYGLSPYQGGFTYHAITGKRDRNKNVWFGIGRSIIDPQKWLNKFFSTILYSMMSNAKGGIMAEEDAFKDARKAESEWANPSAITWMKKGAVQDGKVIPKPPATYPQGLDRLMEFTLNALPQTSGLNVELMGLADRVQAGVVEAQRKQSAMAIIAWAFDAMRRYYRSMGKMQARYVIDYVPEGTLVMVNGEQSKQYVPLIKNSLSFKFDVIVDEAPTSVNMKERVWMVLEKMIPQLLQAGMQIPPEVLDYSPLPTDLAQKWKQAMKPDPKKQQTQEAAVMADLQGKFADAKDKESQATLNQAKAQEIMAGLSNPGNGEQIKAQMTAQAKAAELLMKEQVANMQAELDARIATMKANKDADTALMIEQMKIDSAERIAAMQAAFDARIEAERLANERRQQEQAASQQAESNDRESQRSEKSDATLAAAISGMTAAISQLGKPKKFKVKRDANGDMTEVGE